MTASTGSWRTSASFRFFRAGRYPAATTDNPGFLREGSAIDDSLYPDRIVVGAEGEATLSTLRELPWRNRGSTIHPSLPVR